MVHYCLLGVKAMVSLLYFSFTQVLYQPYFSFYIGRKWPLNYHLSYELCFVVAIVVLLISLVLPKTIEKKREPC